MLVSHIVDLECSSCSLQSSVTVLAFLSWSSCKNIRLMWRCHSVRYYLCHFWWRYILTAFLPHAVNGSGLRKVLFLAPSICDFCLCMKYLGNCWTDLRQIHTEDVFGPLHGRVWRSKVEGQGHQGQKLFFGSFVRFIFSKTSLASSVSLFACL